MPTKSTGLWGYGSIPSNLSDLVPYYHGWLVQGNWSAIETSPGVYNWSPLQSQMQLVIDAGLSLGISIWINPSPYYPAWLTNKTYKVPIVTTTASANTYAYYFDVNGNFKTRLLSFYSELIKFLKSKGTTIPIYFLQSIEGHQELSQPYNGTPPLAFKITDADFLKYQKSVWNYLSNHINSVDTTTGDIIKPFNLILNAASSDSISDYILTNLPYAWIKRYPDGQDYSYNLESFDWVQIEQERTIKTANPGQFRKRSDFSVTVNRPWFQQAYKMNSLMVFAHALTKQVDILTISPQNLPDLSSDQTLSDLFNDLSGQESGVGSDKLAYYFANTKIDGSNIVTWTTASFGHVLNGGADSSTNPLDYITKANLTRLTNIKNNVGNGCMLDTTQFGPSAGGETRYDDKFNNDIGMKIKEGPLTRFVTQPDWEREIKRFFRIGNVLTDSWGRFAVGFKTTVVGALGSEFFFKFTPGFKQSTFGVTIRIYYYNAGAEHWAVRTETGSLVQTIINTGTNEWMHIDVSISVYATGHLTNHASNTCDFSIEHVSGALSFKLGGYRITKQAIANSLPIISCAVTNAQITVNTNHVTATASDSDGVIVSYLWSWSTYPTGAAPIIAAPNASETDVGACSISGDYTIGCLVTDDRGGTSYDSITFTKTIEIVNPTADAGPAKTITHPTVTSSIGGTGDVAYNDATIASILWTNISKPLGASNPTIATNTTATTNIGAMTSAGEYKYQKQVTDSNGNIGTATVIVTVNPNPTNTPPAVNAGADAQITGTTYSLVGTATDPDTGGKINWTSWTQVDANGNATALPAAIVFATSTALSCAISAMTVNGDYFCKLQAGDNNGAVSSDVIKISKVTSVVSPTANAGPDKEITGTSTTVGGTDTVNTYPIASILWTMDSKPSGAATPTIATPTTTTTSITGITTNGIYLYRKRVTDTHSNFTEDTVKITKSAVVSTNTEWGILVSDNVMSGDQKMTLMNELNVKLMRTSVYAIDWYSHPDRIENMLQRLISEGKFVCLNVNWKGVSKNAVTGEKIPNQFVTGTDLTHYLQGLDNILTTYAPIKIGGINFIRCVVIENEPLTAHFYDENAPIANYIAQVQQAIPVCHKHGIPCADGAIHVPFQIAVKNAEDNGTTGSLTGRDLKAWKMIQAYSVEWANIDHVNTHSSVGGSDNNNGLGGEDNPTRWATAFAYMKQKSGKIPIVNEWVMHSTNDTLLTTIATQHANSHIALSVIYSGKPNTTNDALPMNGTSANPYPDPALNNLGTAYKNIVAQFS